MASMCCMLCADYKLMEHCFREEAVSAMTFDGVTLTCTTVRGRVVRWRLNFGDGHKVEHTTERVRLYRPRGDR